VDGSHSLSTGNRFRFGARQALVKLQNCGTLLEAIAAGFEQRSQLVLVRASSLYQVPRQRVATDKPDTPLFDHCLGVVGG
jgi:hypothetical protein